MVRKVRNTIAYVATFVLTGLAVSLLPVKDLLGKMELIEIAKCETCSSGRSETPKPIQGSLATCTSLPVDRVPEPDLARKAGFASVEAAAAYLEENREAFQAITTALRGPMGDRFLQVLRCLGFDKDVHPVARLRVEWHLKYSPSLLQASGFRLRQVEGLAADAPGLQACFARAFERPVELPVTANMPTVSYDGVFPLPMSYRM